MKKMKVLLVLLLAVTLISGCGVKAGEQKDLLEAVKEKGVIRVGTAGGYFPFEMMGKNGNLIGFDIDMANRIAEKMGVKIELHNYDFSGLIPALQSSKIDLIVAGMTITEKRAETVDFSIPYFNAGISMLVNQNTSGVKGWEDLDKKGNTIAVSMGTTGDIVASKLFKNAQIKRFDGSSLAGLEVVSGKVNAVLHDYPWVAIYSKKNPTTTYPVLKTLNEENLGIAVAKGNDKMVKFLNNFIEEYLKGEDYQKDYNYWFVDMEWWSEDLVK